MMDSSNRNSGHDDEWSNALKLTARDDGKKKGKQSIPDLPEFNQSKALADDDVRCGFGSYRPDWLQVFNNPKCLLFFLCAYCMILGFVVNGINNVNTTSIERRFNLPSAKVGLISSAYDIAAGILGVFVSYYGSGRNKARWVAGAGVIMAMGSLVMSLPHFTTGAYELGELDQSFCEHNGTSNTTTCAQDTETYLSNYLYVFILGQMLHGVGGTTVYTVGVALLDDSLPSQSTPLYLGILYGCSVLGPGLGFVIGGQFLSYYVDFDTVNTSSLNITTDDPRWVGAWWFTFLVCAILNLVVSLPLFAYGKELPSARYVSATRRSQAHTSSSHTAARVGEKGSLTDLLRVLYTLLMNPVFCFMTLSMLMEGLVIAGSATFLPKFIENEYKISASLAAMLTGIAVVPSAAGGQFVGGIITRKLKLDIRGAMKVCIVGVFGALVSSSVLWLKCDKEIISGIDRAYEGFNHTPYTVELTVGCNAHCRCSTDVFEPVCDPTGNVYFTPCHAGCSKDLGNGNYSGCACVKSPTFANSSVEVTSKGCRESCSLLYVFLSLMFVLIFFVFIPVAPGDSVQLRCVPEEHKTFAQGVKLLIVRLLGTVPGPILYGRLLDESCVVWREKCDSRLSCWVYDSNTMARNLFLLMIGTCIFSGLFLVLALRLYRPPETPDDSPKTEETVAKDDVEGDVREPIIAKGVRS
ncbi:solute carrier organic anion transporter family member 4C1-like [Haliotis cracherodii]|uniref:solute carrier organic anion transporter family member 4C1-like n=1 Tax=Haliotis cracherodii TaxID=6455 RepID=UPI0039E72E47